MLIKNIINIENNRNDNEYYLIHLFKEGNWWSGYELSAFLCHHYENNLKEKLKINIKHLKSENIDYIKIGLREISFDKYLPNNVNYINIIDDNHITINAENFINYDINKDNYYILLNDIKSKMKNSNKEISIKQCNNNNNISLLLILYDILNFNIDNKTNNELISFINNLKNNVNNAFLKMLH